MNTQTVKKLAALLITLGAAVSVSPVFAQTAQAAPQSLSRQETAHATGKTRAQVYAELTQAQEAGLIPAGNAHYPPNAATIERNRINFALAEESWNRKGEAAPQTPPQVTLQRGSVLNTAAAAGKTRAQVYAELIQAQEAGLIPAEGHNYPPSAATIARNRIDFALAEQSWKKPGEAAPQTPQVTLQPGSMLNTATTAGKTRGWIIRKAKKS